MKAHELERDIQNLFEGTLNKEHLGNLEEQLRQDSEARELYKTYLHIHNGLQLQADSIVDSPVISIDSILKRQKRKNLYYSALATAAVVLLSLTALYLYNVDFNRPAAGKITANHLSRFEVIHAEPRDEQTNTLEKGSTLRVTQGSVALTLRNGVESVIEAPAELTLRDIDSIQLDKGKAWFNVPPEAIGFQVTTEEIDIIDLGTEFGVLSSPYAADEIHVFKGKVEAVSFADLDRVHQLSKDSALRVTEEGTLVSIEPNPDTFHTTLTPTLPYYHWNFDSVENGGFAATSKQLDEDSAFAKPQTADASTMLVAGRRGNAVKFTDIAGQEMPLGFSGPTPEQAHTIACWVKLPEPGRALHAITSWSFPDSENRFGRWAFSPTNIGLKVFCSGTQLSYEELSLNTWHHVAYVYTGEADKNQLPKVRLFVDGKERFFKHRVADKVYRPTASDQTHLPAPFTIGAGIKTQGNPQPVLNATIDDLFYIEGALTPGQIRTLADKNRFE